MVITVERVNLREFDDSKSCGEVELMLTLNDQPAVQYRCILLGSQCWLV